MKVKKLNLYKYQKSLTGTQKVKRTISKTKPYVSRYNRQEAETEQEILASLKKQKEFDKEFQEKLNNTIEESQVREIQYYTLLLYGKQIEKEKIIELLRARKAK